MGLRDPNVATSVSSKIVKMKSLGEKISMLTAYDALMAEIIDLDLFK